MTIRELAPTDQLPWTTQEIGWNPAQLDRRTVWVAEKAGEIVGMIIAAEVHQTLLILRILGKGGSWLRPMWRHIRHACFHRGVGAFWSIAENGHENEVRLAEVVQLDDAEFAVWQPQDTFAIAGRWHAPVSRNRTDPDRNRRSRLVRRDSLRTGESALLAQQLLHGSPAAAGGPAGGGPAGGPAEGGLLGGPAQRAGVDGRIADGDGLEYGDSRRGGSSFRSKLYREIFGTDDSQSQLVR